MSSVNNLTFEQKEMLLRSSRSPALLKKNSTFSHVMPSFSLKATFGIKNKKNRGTVDQQQFFNTVTNSGSFANEVDSINGEDCLALAASTHPVVPRITDLSIPSEQTLHLEDMVVLDLLCLAMAAAMAMNRMAEVLLAANSSPHQSILCICYKRHMLGI